MPLREQLAPAPRAGKGCRGVSLAQLYLWLYLGEMAYAGQFLRLVLIGTIYDDIFNTTVSLVPVSGSTVTRPTTALLTDLAVPIQAFWSNPQTSGGINITSSARLTSFKLNRIGPDGRYVDDTVYEHVFTGGIAGAGTSGQPAQIAMAATLRGLDERARAGKGRMYFPANNNTDVLGSDGRIIAGNAQQAAQRIYSFLQNIDGVLIDSSWDAKVGIASRSGTGAFQGLARVTVGRVPDTIRSRRSKLDEDPQPYPPYPA